MRLKSALSGSSVRLLLDTQILVWMVNGDRRLRTDWVTALGQQGTDLYVSAVVAYEYADLQSRKRIPVDEPLAELVERFGLTILDYPASCWEIAISLPNIHRDPVDRMLIAHALASDMILMTADATIRRYPVRCA